MALSGFDSDKFLLDPQGQNSYGYARSNPVNNVDPDGKYFDSIIDIGFIAYDIGSMAYHYVKNQDDEIKSDIQALGLDTASLALPGVVGMGMVARVAGKGEEVVKIATKATTELPGLKRQTELITKIGSDINGRVQNLITSVFKKEDKLSGGTFGAIKKEIQTGERTGGVFHAVSKAPQKVNEINNILRDNSLGKIYLKPIEIKVISNFKDSFIKLINTWNILKK